MKTYRFHPLADLFPMLSDGELVGLAQDIKVHGLNQAVVISDGKILDGRNRYLACQKVGVDVKVEEFAGPDPLAFVVSANLKRRQLSESQRAMVAAKIANLKRGNPEGSNQHQRKGANLRISESVTQPAAATMLNVSRRSVQTAKALMESAPKQAARVESGEVSLNRAVRESKHAEAVVRLKAVETASPVKALDGLYDVVVVDPPWPMEKVERDCRPNQTAALDYPVMSLAEIGDLKIPAQPTAHLWLWTTHRFLPDAFGILNQWGFKYCCTFVWAKAGGFQPCGLPQFNCEFALYARRGAPVFVETKAFPVCFEGKRMEHSRKPDEFYDVIRRVTAGRRIDMFSRRSIPGFDGWGFEAKAGA